MAIYTPKWQAPNHDNPVIQWLLAGDPSIRWQVMRDLLDAPEPEWQVERRQLLECGWAANLLSRQNTDGGWGEGVYSPKWTSTTYTLLGLREMGLPGDCTQAQRGTQVMIGQMLGETRDAGFFAPSGRLRSLYCGHDSGNQRVFWD